MNNIPNNFNNIEKEDKADIIELQNRIEAFHNGKEDEERFKLYRLTRGVYGQRQLGVQMFRLKIPGGKITADQLSGVANISDEFATGNLHLTTRQNIQMHYVKLDDSPEIWRRLAVLGLTAREACGNTVRNITASPTAGIDPDEAFDVTPYVFAVFEYFLRNPICQEMGRKIKPAFSSSDKDSAYTYFSDFGLIPQIKDGTRGFKFVVGGGLGALSISAKKVFDFLPIDQVIPFIEASLRVFDRYGEREKRQKARMKFLIKDLGLEKWQFLVNEELEVLDQKSVPIQVREDNGFSTTNKNSSQIEIEYQLNTEDHKIFHHWLQTNTLVQKQRQFRGVYLKIQLGDLSSHKARALAKVVKKYAADDIRITINQNLLLRYVHQNDLPQLYLALKDLGLANPGYNTIADITACPGTDTCNLGVTNSTGLAKTLEQMLKDEFPDLLMRKGIDIKISGCMNACGQHMASGIGFHGSSIKHEGKVIPAMQVVVGGGIDSDGTGFIGQKVTKLPTKRIPSAVRLLLADYDSSKSPGQEYIHYAQDKGRRYFYDLLKNLGDTTHVDTKEYFDWGQDDYYNQEIGVGECAGVILDVVGTILKDAEQKLSKAVGAIDEGLYKDAVYHAYSAYVITAKAVLLSEDIKCNTHIKIINDFQSEIIDEGIFDYPENFVEDVLRMKRQIPSESFARKYSKDAHTFYKNILQNRLKQFSSNKEVVDAYYKA